MIDVITKNWVKLGALYKTYYYSSITISPCNWARFLKRKKLFYTMIMYITDLNKKSYKKPKQY